MNNKTKLMLLIGMLSNLSWATVATLGTDSSDKSRSNLRNERYCEILTVNKGSSFKEVRIKVYNTVGFNDCPAEEWTKINGKTLA